MPEDQKTALPGAEDGSAEKATATPAEGTSDADRREAEIAQLRKERDDAVEKARREAELRMSHQSTVEEAKRIMASGRNATDDPLDAEIAELEAAQRAFAANNTNDPATNSALARARREREQRESQKQLAERVQQAQQDMGSVPEQYKERTWALWSTGRYWTVSDAMQAAKGEEADELRKKLEERDTKEKQREAEILARQEKAPGSPRGSGGGGGATGTNKMPLSDYISKVNALRAAKDFAGAAKLTAEKDAGKIQIDYSA